MSEGIHWKSISRFESHDFVAKWYRKVHGRSASAAKVGQINACFAHGREYFRNAERSEMSVKPLLLYYGVLSCCRGVVLANNPEKKEESLKPRHGLETVDWQNTLSGGIKNVLELQVRASDGTFRELVDVCWHMKTLHMFSGPTNDMCSTGHLAGPRGKDRQVAVLGVRCRNVLLYPSRCPGEATPMTHATRQSRRPGQEATPHHLDGSITDSPCRIAGS